MKKIAYIFIFFLSYQGLFSQEMNLTKLDSILNSVTDSISSNRSSWSFKIKGVPLMCIADSTHNRMRIISPIADSDRLNDKLKTASLIANFHTALDVKYAISDNILWSAYIHPLRELSEKQVLDAISQVYYANIHFGTTFSSTSLVFPGRKQEKKETPKKEVKVLDRI